MNDDYKYKDRKNKQKVFSKPRKRPTISKVSKLRYALESPKEKDRQLETKKEEIKNQQKSMNMDFYNENYKRYREESLMIFTCENRKEPRERNRRNRPNDPSLENDIPKELIESLTIVLDRANTMGLNSQNTEIDNIKSEIDSSAKNESIKIDMRKDDILYIIWNLKPIEDDRMDVQYDPRISRQDKLDLVKNTQSTKDIKDNIPIEEGYRKFIEIENKIIINKAESNIATYHSRDEISLEKAYEDWKKRINRRQIDDDTNKVKKNEHEAFKSYERPTEPNERT
ncbi:41002_t:CDS:2 [Gigaspora margarita]|uniref:41002_t:CDS:1 n=1 Tax=Gigaspora margarita TaxID=4874 RepID=A0ABN7URZ3_GIGMA|nr:41002_t:CDS:2 [Gigaspora margarita]